jgi:hypothetical protein
MPLPTMHNARLAIAALGVECSYDVFHSKMLFGFRGDDVRHELKSIIGEVTDDGIIRLRQLMSDRFGVDLEDKATRDAVKSMALDHCFDPVCDMLDKAEAEWDGTKRLDSMAVTYFNCEDTELNRAIFRKTMIAAVKRARVPGCKFDNILTLESPEGHLKSSAFNILAGDDNFSDESILGKSSREVQEQLSGVWIHENADLAGMRKAEVEHVKAFASRQVDIARPAYGHFPKRQKRRSIEVATTNSVEYLQSPTGNRRFWTVTVLILSAETAFSCGARLHDASHLARASCWMRSSGHWPARSRRAGASKTRGRTSSPTSQNTCLSPAMTEKRNATSRSSIARMAWRR